MKHLAFLSYSRSHLAWTRVLRENLERALRANGSEALVYMDDVDILPGDAWIGSLQHALASTRWLVLVATPQSLASQWVHLESDAVLARRLASDHPGVIVAQAIQTPLPPFLDRMQAVDFTHRSEEGYRDALSRLVAALCEFPDLRTSPRLPETIRIPDPPFETIPGSVRQRLEQLVSRLVDDSEYWDELSVRLRPLSTRSVRAQLTTECTATAAISVLTKSEKPTNVARTIADSLTSMGDEWRERVNARRKRIDELEKRIVGHEGGIARERDSAQQHLAKEATLQEKLALNLEMLDAELLTQARILERLEEADSSEEDADTLPSYAELRKLNEELDESRTQLEAGRVEQRTIKGEIAQVNERLEESEQAVTALEKLRDDAQSGQQRARDELAKIDQRYGSLRSMQDECSDLAGEYGRELQRASFQKSLMQHLRALYCGHVVGDHRHLIPFFDAASTQALLAHIYVRLDLLPDSLDRATETDLYEPRSLRELLSMDPRHVSWVTRHWIVRGDPGSGKTTMLRHLAAVLATEPGAAFCPVFFQVPRAVKTSEPFTKLIADRLSRADYDAELIPDMLQREADEGRLVILLDGLDEVPGVLRPEANQYLRDLSRRYPRANIVVTTRPIGFVNPAPDRLREVKILPFDGDRRIQFLAQWFGRGTAAPDWGRARAAATRLKRDSVTWELAGNPLYITLMALLIERGEDPARERVELYSQVFRLLVYGQHRPDAVAMKRPHVVRQTLAALAFELLLENRDAENLHGLAGRLYDANPLNAKTAAARLHAKVVVELREQLYTVEEWKSALERFLREQALNAGILAPYDGSSHPWKFLHRTFQEALSAEHLVVLGATDSATLRMLLGDVEVARGQWAEVFALLVGHADKPDALITDIVTADQVLGLRALATARSVSAETVVRILKLDTSAGRLVTLRGTYLSAIRAIDDAERCLQLLDRLRRETRTGDALYAVSVAAGDVAKRWPDYTDASNKLVSGICDCFEWSIDEADHVYFERLMLVDGDRGELFKLVEPTLEAATATSESRAGTGSVRPYRIMKVPVTNWMFGLFDPSYKPREFGGFEDSLDDHPVVDVSWYSAVAFCWWLRTLSPETAGARLPTRDEWVFAASAGVGDDEAHFPPPSALDEVAWHRLNSEKRTHEVASRQPNSWGIYDCIGNVAEWLTSAAKGWDGIDAITAAPLEDDGRVVPIGHKQHVAIGGSYLSKLSRLGVRAERRVREDRGYDDIGFRVVIPIPGCH